MAKNIPKKVLDYLDKQGYKYEIVEHKTTYTAWDKSQTRKAKPQEVAKCLVLAADKEHFLAMVPANKNLDKQKIGKIVNAKRKKEAKKIYKKIDLAKEAWMKKNILGKVGAVPPFGKLLKLDVFIDRSLLKGTKMYLGSGDYSQSIRVLTKQFEKIEMPTKGSFAKSKKK